jgi:VPDSG-CTERM motif
MKSPIPTFGVLLVALLTVSVAAWADPLTIVSVKGTVWHVAGNMVPAPTADPVGTLLGNFEASQINFWTPGNQGANHPLSLFLSNGGATAITVSDTDLAKPLSNCLTGNNSCPSGLTPYSTIIRLDGIATFVAGTTYTLQHDDGAVMIVDGKIVIDSPAPTGSIPTAWKTSSSEAGWHPFTIYYSGTNGDPEVLRLTGAVPDGGVTLMLLGGALAGLETLRRKSRA